jgi:glycerophosphoryl diester phosphodiesterase
VPRYLVPLLAALIVGSATAALAAAAAQREPTLTARAILPADASAPAPFAAAPDTEPRPARGARQPVGGFSALIDAPGRDTFWAMPDNGFGSKANSRSFLLRVYRVHTNWETARGGRGDVQIRDWINLRDPARKVPFEIVNEGTRGRLLTGGDFDIESMRVDHRGDLWFGDEFGPFLLHTDATGKVLEAPIPLRGVRSPDYPPDARAPFAGTPNLGRSNGIEGMAISKDRRRLYPVLEGAVQGDDPRARRVYEFDIRSRRYARGWREYRVAEPSFLVADFTALGGRRFVALERDNEEGEAARHKRAFVAEPRRGRRSGRRSSAPLRKRLVVDLLNIADPAEISLPGRPGDIGLGDPFSMPYVTIESVLPLDSRRLAFVNDTNFGSTGRNPDLPDYSDFIVVRVPAKPRGGP